MTHKKLLSIAAVVAFALGLPMGIRAAENTTKEAADAGKKAEAGKPVPLHGIVASVDKAAKTFTITYKKGDKVYVVTADTKITKKGAPATFDDIAVKGYVTGSYVKDGDKLIAHTLKVGEEKPAKDEGGAKKDPGGAKPEDKK